MKDFMIIYENIKDGKTLEGLTSAKDMLSASLKQKAYAKDLEQTGFH